MLPSWIIGSSIAALALAVLFVIASLRNSSRLQKRLFWLFLLLSLLPALVVTLVDVRLSQRHLSVLDSPGLNEAHRSAVALARRVLDAERERTQEQAELLARQIHDGVEGAPDRLPDAPDGCSYWFDGSSDRVVRGRDGPDPTRLPREAVGRAWSAPRRRTIEGESYLLASTREPVHDRGRLYLLRPLPPDLFDQLNAVTAGSQAYRQLGLFYGSLLRWDTLLTLAAMGLVLLVLSLLLSRRLARTIGGPIQELARGTEIVASGDLDHRVVTNAVDELADLVTAFNRMTADLATSKDELVRAERVAAWQGIARRLAHEIKNPLTPIELSMHRIRKRASDPDVLDCVDTVLEETGNLRRLADEFSLYARLPQPRPEAVDLHGLLAGVVELYAGRSRVEIIWEGWSGTDVPVLQADAGQLRQVFSNLVKNSLEAMGSGGRLRISSLRGDGDPGTSDASMEVAGGERWIRVEIADDGPGFEGDAEALFEPHFTTKDSGTGLGLAISRKIVEDHGGRLRARNLLEGGAVFLVELPPEGPDPRANRSDPRTPTDREGGASDRNLEERS